MKMLRAMLAAAIGLIGVATALAPISAGAQSADREQHEGGDAFYYRHTGGVPPG